MCRFLLKNFAHEEIQRLGFCVFRRHTRDRYVRDRETQKQHRRRCFFLRVVPFPKARCFNNTHKHAAARRSNRRPLIYTKKHRMGLAMRDPTARKREREDVFVVKTRASSTGAKGSENSPFNPRGSTHPALLAFAFLPYEFISEN